MLMEAKKLSDVPPYLIPISRRTSLFFNHNPQSVKQVPAFLEKENEIPGWDFPSRLHHPSEILRLIDPLLFRKPEGSFHRDPPHLICGMDPLPILRDSAFKRSASSSPSFASVLRHFDRSWYSSSPGIRVSSFFWGYWADMFSSLNPSLWEWLVFWNS